MRPLTDRNRTLFFSCNFWELLVIIIKYKMTMRALKTVTRQVNTIKVSPRFCPPKPGIKISMSNLVVLPEQCFLRVAMYLSLYCPIFLKILQAFSSWKQDNTSNQITLGEFIITKQYNSKTALWMESTGLLAMCPTNHKSWMIESKTFTFSSFRNRVTYLLFHCCQKNMACYNMHRKNRVLSH